MSVDVGTRLGSLEITALLGKGGMGEVYRARDTKLKRDAVMTLQKNKVGTSTTATLRLARHQAVTIAPTVSSLDGSTSASTLNSRL
jgi:hypothetical protein